MIISIDGTIGSGKTTLTSLLALHFDGADFKYSPLDHDEEPVDDLDQFISEYHKQRASLKQLTKKHDAKGYISNIMLLHNLIRNMLIRSYEPSVYTFVDSFWDPFWHFRSEHYDEFYPVIRQCIPLPDVSFFLDVSAKRSIQRAKIRDPNTKHTADANSIQRKMDAFKKWAVNNIPNFFLLKANVAVSEVMKEAIPIIEGKK